MGQLNDLYVSSSYQGLLKMTDSTNGLTNTLQTVQTGDGDNSPLQMSLTQINISGSFTVNNLPITGSTSGTSGTSGSSGSSGTSGSSGSSGTSGTGFNVLGIWDNTINYIVGDVVYYNGSSYVATQNNINKQPSVEPAFWQLFANAGSNGTSGTAGTSGTSGSSGSSGTSGSNGSDGSSGTSGTSGSDGSSGTSGSSGSTGTSGSSGSSGTSGTSGTSGISPTYRGVWDVNTIYSVGDIVYYVSIYPGATYISLINNNQYNDPFTSPFAWGVLNYDGANGTSGTSGISGSSGTSGIDGSSGTSGTSGLNGSSGTSGASGGAPYRFNASTSAGQVDDGEVAYNNTVMANVTRLYISDLDMNDEDLGTWILSWDDSTTTSNRGQIMIVSRTTGDITNIFNVTGVTINQSGYYEILVQYLDGVRPFNNQDITVMFSRTGNAGTSGTSGVAGSSGTSGTSGSSGVGTSGTSGTSGSSGSTGTSGTSGIDGQSNVIFDYKAKTNSTSGNPGNTYILWNNATQSGSTQINISHLDKDGYDIDVFLGLIPSGTTIILQSVANSTQYQKWVVGTGVEVAPNSYWTFPVTLTQSTFEFGNNDEILLIIGQLPSGTSGTSGTSGINGSSGTSGSNGSSGTSGSDGSSGTSGSSGSAGTSGSSGIVDYTGLITTGSISSLGVTGSTQSISGGFLDNASGSYIPALNVDGLNVYGITRILPTLDVSGSLQAPNLDLGDATTGSQFPIITLNLDSSNGPYSAFAGNQTVDKANGNTVGFAASCFNTVDGTIAGVYYGYGTGNNVPFGPGTNDATIMMTYSGDTNLHITRNSIITGSLQVNGNTTISGSLVGNAVNNGLIKIASEARISGSVPLYITASAPVSQSNIILNGGAPAQTALSGSIIISGSNNIISNPYRVNSIPQGTFGYIGGNNNIINSIPIISTSSFLSQTNLTQNNNILNSQVTIDSFASGTIPAANDFNNFSNNNIGGVVILRHKSGSFTFANNNSQGQIQSFATQSILFPSGAVAGPSIQGNVHAGGSTVLSHISSSILYNQNISDSSQLLIRNSATHPAALNGSGSVSVTNNIFGGGTNTLTFSGTGPQNTKGVNNNIIVGNTNELNLISSGSNAFVTNTGIIGLGLIVSGSAGGVGSGGSTFVGRYNATGSNQESTNETVFVVGTGTNAGNRRNAIHVDNGNNTRITGSLQISGSLLVNGESPLIGTTGLITTGSYNSLQIMSSSLLVANKSNAAHPYLMQLEAFDFTNNALSVTGTTNITGSLILNGVAVTGGAGTSGTSGTSGQAGSSGTSGTSGSDGSSGTSGQAGSSGTSGTSAIADLTGIITTGSISSDQTIIGQLRISGSATQPFQIGSGENTAKINVYNGNTFLYHNTSNYSTVIGNNEGASNGFIAGSEKNMLFTGFYLGFNSGSQNTIIAGGGGANFRSGSSNCIIGNVGNLQYGNFNTYIGSGGPNALEDNTFRVAAGGSDILVKSGSLPLQVGGDMEITGSLRISNMVTGSIKGNVVPVTISSNTASLDLSQANFFTLNLSAGSTHINPTNISAGQTVNIRVSTVSGSFVTFPGSVKQQSGSLYQPTVGTSTDVLTMLSFDGSNVLLTDINNLV